MTASALPRFRRLLAFLADAALVVWLGAIYAVWALPWLKAHEAEIPWPWEHALPLLMRAAPVLAGIGFLLLRTFGPGRRNLDRGLTGIALLILSAPLAVWGSVRWTRARLEALDAFPTMAVGYLDRHGKVVIPPRFVMGQPFRGGRAAVLDRGEDPGKGLCLIDVQGQVQGKARAIYTQFEVLPNGFAVERHPDSTRAYFDPAGNPVFQNQEVAFFPPDRTAPVVLHDGPLSYHLVTLEDRSLGARTFEDLTLFKGGVAGFKDGKRWGLVDAQGKVLLEPCLEGVLGSARGVYPALQNGFWGLVEATGRWIVPPRFERLLPFDAEGPALARARHAALWGYIRPDGTWAIPPAFELAQGFTPAGYARVKRDGRWGVVDAQGGWAVPLAYDEVLPPREAPFTVRQGPHWGFVAPGGRVIVPPVLSVAGPFRQGTAFGRGWSRWICFDAEGHGRPLPGHGLDEASLGRLDADLLPFRAREAR
jgi:hypothetical protein